MTITISYDGRFWPFPMTSITFASSSDAVLTGLPKAHACFFFLSECWPSMSVQLYAETGK